MDNYVLSTVLDDMHQISTLGSNCQLFFFFLTHALSVILLKICGPKLNLDCCTSPEGLTKVVGDKLGSSGFCGDTTPEWNSTCLIYKAALGVMTHSSKEQQGI